MMFYADNFCRYSECIEDGQHFYTFTGPYADDPTRTHSVKVKGEDLYKYRQGAMIQDAFPYLSTNDREFLMSGISPEGWDAMWKEEEE